MLEFRRGLAVALWVTLLLIAYDVARLPLELLPAHGAWAYVIEAAGTGLLHYGIASLVVLQLAAALLGLRRRRSSRPAGRSPSTLPLYAGVAAAAFALVSLLCAMGERRSPAGWLTPSWTADAQIAALGSLAAGWAVAGAASACGRSGPPALRLALLGLIPFAPAVLPAISVFGAAGLPFVREKIPQAPPGAPDIVLIVADALRADGLSGYGGRSLPTPRIDTLAAEGVRFSDVTAHASATLPSTASILTSRLPSEHGVRGHEGRIRSGVRTLAEALAARGYNTTGIAGNLIVSRGGGFDRGFRRWDQDADPHVRARHPYLLSSRILNAAGLGRDDGIKPRASDLVDRALSMLSRPSRAPRFLYLHLMDPHDPYAPPADLARSADPDYAGKLTFQAGTLHSILLGDVNLDEADLRHARALYAAEIASMDRDLGRLLDALRDRIRSGRTIVAFTSDHGEEFLEHGWMGHGHGLHSELLQVPLIIARGGIVPPGAVVDAPVSHLDLAPTLLDLAGLAPEQSFRGRSLAALIRGEAGSSSDEPIFSQEDTAGRRFRTTGHRVRAARLGAWKVILSSSDVFGIGDWTREVYDLASDPAEASPLASPPPEAERLEARLREWIAEYEDRPEAESEPDPESLRRLRALGYIE